MIWRAAIVIAMALFAGEARAGDGGTDARAPAEAEDGSLAKTLSGEAKALYEIARSSYEAGDPAGALAKFQRAHEISGDPRLLWNMAACEAALRHWARAMTLVDRYLTTGGALLGDRDKERAARFRAAAKPFVAAVELTTAPASVGIAVDGEAIGTTPLGAPLYLDAGRRRVHFTKNGYRGIVRLETALGGSDLVWTVTLERLRVRPLGP